MIATVEHMGGCLCGAIRFRARGEPTGGNICYCTQCRRQTGSPMVSFVTYPADRFELLSGSASSYRASDFAVREFCGRCGSALFWRRDGGNELDIFLGSLDHPEKMPRPKKQIWTQHRIPWVPAQPDIPSFPKSGYEVAMAATEQHTGGCLCGAVRYRLTGPPLRVGLCHCSQCRRQTGSALPSFVTWPRDRLEVTKGQPSGIRLSDVATRQFCRDCGSPLFWRPDKGDEITVLLGSLDDAEAMPKPSYELWTERRLHWVPELEGIKSYPQEPGRG